MGQWRTQGSCNSVSGIFSLVLANLPKLKDTDRSDEHIFDLETHQLPHVYRGQDDLFTLKMV